MTTFKEFLQDQEQSQGEAQKKQAEELAEKAKEVSQPENIQRMIAQLGAKNLDDLIRKLEANPQVQQVIRAYQGMKGKTNESILGSMASGAAHMAGSVAKGAWSLVTGILKRAIGFALKSTWKTIKHIFAPFGPGFEDATVVDKINYAGTLILMLGLSGLLLASGAPMAVAVGALPWSATWFGLMWFGKNVLEPALHLPEKVGYAV